MAEYAGMVADPDIQRCKLLTEEQYLTKVEEHGDEFSAAMGAEGIVVVGVQLEATARHQK